jgi:hypothetical protein
MNNKEVVRKDEEKIRSKVSSACEALSFYNQCKIKKQRSREKEVKSPKRYPSSHTSVTMFFNVEPKN